MKYHLAWLKEIFNNGQPIKYIFFWGHTNKNGEDIGKFVFSQWYSAPFNVDGINYSTTEHWMMAHKAKLFHDQLAFENIIKADKPGEAKAIGRQINDFDEGKWNEAKYEIVKQGNFHKFQQNPPLKNFLLGTADRVLVEASPADPVWGIGLSQDAPMVENPHTWKGSNLLGFALMETRDDLKLLSHS